MTSTVSDILQTPTFELHKEWEKWIVPKYMYDKEFFPQFLSGLGYIMSLQVAECILQKTKAIHKHNFYDQKEYKISKCVLILGDSLGFP